MRIRPIIVTAAAAALVAAIPAQAATPTLDGKKVKTLTFSGSSTPQTNDQNLVTDQVPASIPGVPNTRPTDYRHCAASRCLTFKFLFKPAKGVRSRSFSAKLTWTLPGQDYDLYIVDTRYATDVAHCGASAGQGEFVTVDGAIPGHTYLFVVDQYRALPDTVKGTVSFPATAFKSQVPNAPDTLGGVFPFACGFPS